MNLPAIREGSLPFSRIEQIVDRRRVHHARDYLPFFFESNQRREEGNATDEILGTVNRINDPAGVDSALALAEFLAKKSVVGKARAQDLDNFGFAFTIRPGDWG